MSYLFESLKKSPFHEHIADTYFYQKTRKKKHSQTVKNLKLAFIALSLFVAALFLIIAASHFYNMLYIKFLKEELTSSKVVALFERGRLNTRIIKTLEFRGRAKVNNNSKIANNLIVLNSPEKYNWADLIMDFKFPIDFSKRSLSISFRGKIGGEKINVVLRDVNSRSYRFDDISLASEWRTETISFKGIEEDIDLSGIAHLRFEFGHIGESYNLDSPIDITIYISDIKIIKFPR